MARDVAVLARVVAAGFVALSVSFGIAYSFGVFVPAIAMEFGTGTGATTGLFSVTAFVFFAAGAVTGPLTERIGARPLLTTAGLLIAAGLLGASLAPTIGVAYLSYGVGIGLGVGCALVPVISRVGAAAGSRRRSVAVGIAVTGIGVGTLVGAPIGEQLIAAGDWRFAQRVLAAVALVALLGSALAVGTHERATGPAPRYPRAILVTSRFRMLWICTALASSVMYTPLAHLPAQAVGMGVPTSTAAGLVSLLGLASIAGRLLIGGIHQPVRLLQAHAGAIATAAASVIVWAASAAAGGLAVFAVVFGLGYGAFIALLPLVLAALFGTERLGSLLGIQYVAHGVGALVGPAGTGLLVDVTGDYTVAFVVLTVAGLLAAIVLGPLLTRRPVATPNEETRMLQVPTTALLPLPRKPQRINEHLRFEVGQPTYTPKLEAPDSDWVTRVAYPAFVAAQAREPDARIANFCSIGTGAGLDALAAVEVFDPNHVAVTDLNNEVVEVAVGNIRRNVDCAQLEVAGYVGSLAGPLIQAGRYFDLVYENLPNLPATGDMSDNDGANTGTFYDPADRSPEVPQVVRGDLLALHLECLRDLRPALNTNGRVLCSIGGRRPLQSILTGIRCAHYEPTLLTYSWKIQSEACLVTSAYRDQQERGHGPFYFYDPKALQHIFADYPPSCTEEWAFEIEQRLDPFKVDATEAATLARGGLPVGHTTVVISARPNENYA